MCLSNLSATNPCGFNLSILECKYSYWSGYKYADGVLIYPYWNVNLIDNAYYIKGGKVLIYPYWNVNLPVAVKFAVIERFNLSILECKSALSAQACEMRWF